MIMEAAGIISKTYPGLIPKTPPKKERCWNIFNASYPYTRTICSATRNLTTIDHLFWKYPYIFQAWKIIEVWLAVTDLIINVMLATCSSGRHQTLPEDLCTTWQGCGAKMLATIQWSVWLTCKELNFKGSARNPKALSTRIKLYCAVCAFVKHNFVFLMTHFAWGKERGP